MPPTSRSFEDFERERSELCRQLEGDERWKAVYGLNHLEIEWARAIAGARRGPRLCTAMKDAAARLDPARASEAEQHLERAERWQAEIASWATSGAEGLAGMFEVRVLQLARAWLQLATASPAGRKRARELCGNVERDANGVPSELRQQLATLKKALR